MSFEEFERQARLYVVGAMEFEELPAFDAARREFGAKAEACINQFRRVNAAIALTLRPHPPKHDTKEKLMSRIQTAQRRKNGNVRP